MIDLNFLLQTFGTTGYRPTAQDFINLIEFLYANGGCNGNFDVSILQGMVGFAQASDANVTPVPGYRIFINNTNAAVAYSGYGVTVPANSTGIIFWTGVAWNTVVYTVTKASIGLGNVDNTSDADKPVSTAVQEIINGLLSLIDTNATNIELLNNITSIRGTVDSFAELLALDITENNIRSGDSYIVWTDETWDNNSSLYVYNADITTDGGWVWAGEWTTQIQAADGDTLGTVQSSTDIAFAGGKGTISASAIAAKIIASTQAATRVNIGDNETIASAFGKIRKWFADLNSSAFTTAPLIITNVTEGSAVSIPVGTKAAVIDINTALLAITINFPATPADGDDLNVFFGGTITSQNSVIVNRLTLSGNGKTIVDNGTIADIIAGDSMRYKFINGKWYSND
ncbi:MAG: hypothetical protein LBE82_06255 [Chitinophagaceae bacterium]|jgi:hypothetical protein|nr:hypothetical protein [Chitinophagaceae bacterium]